jgi:tetratricopeptide (TPR) repeat protein
MQEINDARSLIFAGKYREAGVLLDSLLKKEKENDELWYLRGIVSLKLKSYEHAHECFEHALWLNKKAEYYKIKGMAHMEMFELWEALSDFEAALKLDKNDATTYFLIAICYLLLGDERSEYYLKSAWKLNRKRTKTLLKNFYESLIQPDPYTNKKMKDEIEKQLKDLS